MLKCLFFLEVLEVSNLDKHQELKELINKYNKEGRWIAAICAAQL